MKEKPLFSIIIPVYKVEKYIEKCVESILNQDISDFEIILVDDGSPDSCPEICDRLQENDYRIKVIHKKNGGVSAARKDGAELACGEYIICIDGDDWISEGCFTAIEEAIKITGADIVCYGMMYGTSKKYIPSELPYRTGFYSKADIESVIFPTLIKKSDASCFIPSLCGKAIRKSLFVQNLLVNELAMMGEDGACVIPCVYHSQSMYIIRECFYYYRYNSCSATKSNKVFNWEWPKIVAEHIISKIDIEYADFQEQLYRKITHDVFSTVVTQFYKKESYSSIIQDIRVHLNEPFYEKAIHVSRFKHSFQALIMTSALKNHLYFLVALYSKIR